MKKNWKKNGEQFAKLSYEGSIFAIRYGLLTILGYNTLNINDNWQNPKGFRLNLQLKSICKGKSAIDNPSSENP